MRHSHDMALFSAAISQHVFISKLKALTCHSFHSHEQTTYALIGDLETLVDRQLLSADEFAVIIGKAAEF